MGSRDPDVAIRIELQVSGDSAVTCRGLAQTAPNVRDSDGPVVGDSGKSRLEGKTDDRRKRVKDSGNVLAGVLCDVQCCLERVGGSRARYRGKQVAASRRVAGNAPGGVNAAGED